MRIADKTQKMGLRIAWRQENCYFKGSSQSQVFLRRWHLDKLKVTGTWIWEGKAVKHKIGAKALQQEHTCVLKKEPRIWHRWEARGCSQVPQNHLEGSFLLWLRGYRPHKSQPLFYSWIFLLMDFLPPTTLHHACVQKFFLSPIFTS